MTYISKTPILLIAFNRPDLLEQTFAKVRMVQPSHLYIAVDGPRSNRKGESDKVKECQSFAQKVDWSCEVHTLFREDNLGCGRGPAEAISWAFESTERLIILEDDCVASTSFFRFCDEMLERYKDDERVWLISGRSHQSKSKYFNRQDYIFSHYAHTWGWATWKRCWNQFDIMMSDAPQFLELGGAMNVLASKKQGEYYNRRFLQTYKHINEEVAHSWDFQWVYAYMKNGGLGIVPCMNLIKNIGVYGTHTGNDSKVMDMEAEELPDQLCHPLFVIKNNGYEELHFHRHILRKNGLWYRIVIKLKLIIKR